MESSQFTDHQPHFEAIEQLETQGATCDTFRVKLYGKLHFLKRLKPELAGDVRYLEALHKEFETGYRLEHPNLVRYVSSEDNSILIEYVDGETLAHRLASQPDYFRNRKNTDKFLRQLLDVVGYLHSHQVLHLDLKPDNILLTRINGDVKLIDLGCCYTDAFPDTTGRTNAYAAPEQLSGEVVDERTDIFAIGRILEQLPDHAIYNNVIARCTAENPRDRYQSVEEILKAVGNHGKTYRVVLAFVFTLAVILFCIFFWARQQDSASENEGSIEDTESIVHPVEPYESDMSQNEASPVTISRQALPQSSTSVPESVQQQMEQELDRKVDAAYRATIATFCDSVFPSPAVGLQWRQKSSDFHSQVLQVAVGVSEKYPSIPESVVIQLAESRFQSLISYVFNKMRENGKQTTNGEK